jgi:hypothetical protein
MQVKGQGEHDCLLNSDKEGVRIHISNSKQLNIELSRNKVEGGRGCGLRAFS